jgi:hypothetical protein
MSDRAVMSQRAHELATAFERTNDELIAAIERCSDEQLRAVCDGEGWPAVVTAHHLALSYQAIAGLACNIANGQPLPPLTFEMLDQMNAEHAKAYADVSREETLAVMRREGAAAAASVRALSDEQLDRSAALEFVGGQTWSAADMIENGLIGHVKDHGGSIKTALGA